MGRPKKTEGGVDFYAAPFELHDEQKRIILDDILGFDFDDAEERNKANKVCIIIESLLGTYEERVKSMDKAPTNASFIYELKGVQDKNGRTTKKGLGHYVTDLSNELGNISLKWLHFGGQFIYT